MDGEAAIPSTRGKRQSGERTRYGSDVVVEVLKDYQVEYVAANIGSTFRGIWDSVVNYGHGRTPRPISVCHEEIGVALAHGYTKACGRPMAVLLHDLVGLQHASMAVYNAWCDRVPVLLLGAAGPMGTERRRPWIDWVHTAVLPNSQVRDYVKWDDFPYTIRSVPESLIRAYGQMMTEPRAPVYVCFDAGYLEDSLPPGFSIPDVKKYPTPEGPAADPEALRRIARELVSASAPLIVAGRTGRRKQSVGLLVQLAELVGASVVDLGHSFSFPNTHPLDATGMGAMEEADVILSLDAPMLEAVTTDSDKTTRRATSLTREDVRLFEIGLDGLLVRSWAGDYQRLVRAEVRILGETSSAIRWLSEESSEIIEKDRGARDAVIERTALAKKRHDLYRRKWRQEASRRSDELPISPPRLALEVWEKIRATDWVLVNGTLAGWARRLWDWTEPGCFLGVSGGAGLGYGLPASVGAALALKGEGRIAIDLQPDGDLLYSASALWTAAHYRVPLLVVVFNNRAYHNDAEHNRLVSLARGRNAAEAYREGGDLRDPEVDFAALAKSYGVRGMGPVERADELGGSLERAVRTVRKEGRPALVDVVTSVR
jgi:thiamine pyrophosphate-dependent acetolactate synthase large subunit-like protein